MKTTCLYAANTRHLVTRDFGTFHRNELVEVVGQSESGESALVVAVGDYEDRLPHAFPWDAIVPESHASSVLRFAESI